MYLCASTICSDGEFLAILVSQTRDCVLIDYLTGAALMVAGGSILLTRKTRTVATCVGRLDFVPGPHRLWTVLIVALSEPGTSAKVEGINYFADTLLFGGAILALARAMPKSD